MDAEKYTEYRGVDNLHVARIICDDNETGEGHGYICEKPVKLAPVAEVSKTTETSADTHYYDNQPMFVINTEGSDSLTYTVAVPPLEMDALLTGRSFDKDTGMMVEGTRRDDYFAIMYRTKCVDGSYRYVVKNKGSFSIPEDDHKTEDAGTDTTNRAYVYTAIKTTHVFAKGKLEEDGTWTPAAVKGFVLDERYDKVDLSKWFDEIQTPDTVKAKTESEG